MEPTSKPITVISGDIVNSTKLTSEQFEQLLKRIKDIQRLITEGNSSNAHSIERGDEFQTVVHDIGSALRYTIIYRIGIKALGKEFDSRISLALPLMPICVSRSLNRWVKHLFFLGVD